MMSKISRKLYPLFAAFFALSLMLGACGEGDDDVIEDDAGIEESIDDDALGEDELGEDELGEDELEEEAED